MNFKFNLNDYVKVINMTGKPFNRIGVIRNQSEFQIKQAEFNPYVPPDKEIRKYTEPMYYVYFLGYHILGINGSFTSMWVTEKNLELINKEDCLKLLGEL